MVKRKRVKRLLPALLVNGNTTNRKNENEYRKLRYALARHPKREQIVNEAFLFCSRLEKKLKERV